MKQFSMALQLAVLVVIVFSIFVVGFFYSFSHLWDVFVQNWHYSLFLQLLLFVLVFIIFQLRIENFIATKENANVKLVDKLRQMQRNRVQRKGTAIHYV